MDTKQNFSFIWRNMSEKEKIENLKNFILDKAKENKVVLLATNELIAVDINDLIFNQPVDGLLYDLNRLEEVVLTHIKTQKWINDFAVAKVIRRMSEHIEKLETKLKNMEDLNDGIKDVLLHYPS